MWLHQGVVKLAPLEAVLMIGPRGSRHTAVGIQQYPEATHQQENQKQHQETNECKGRPLLGVPAKRWAAGDPDERRPRWEQLIVQRGHIAHPPGRATAELASCLEGGLDGEVGQIGTVTDVDKQGQSQPSLHFCLRDGHTNWHKWSNQGLCSSKRQAWLFQTRHIWSDPQVARRKSMGHDTTGCHSG